MQFMLSMMSSCSDNETLLDLVIRGRWSALCVRAETHPHELSRVGDDDGMTVFHWVCVNDAPVRTLRFLLIQDEIQASDGSVRAVLIRDRNGVTPLMDACVSGMSTEHVKLLIDSAPESIFVMDNDGWTALHYLCHNARNKYSFAMCVLPLLLSQSAFANNDLAFRQDNSGDNTPLSLACDAFGVTQESLQDRHQDKIHTACDPFFCLQFVTRLLDLVVPPERKSWPPLSRVFSFNQVPLIFIDMAILSSPKDVLLEVNDDLDTPLHIAVSQPWRSGLVKRVVEACPRTASLRNRRGLLPLQIALMTTNENWNQDVYALVDACPASLEALELDDSLYSYLLARIRRHETMFSIIKSRPTLVQRRTR